MIKFVGQIVIRAQAKLAQGAEARRVPVLLLVK